MLTFLTITLEQLVQIVTQNAPIFALSIGVSLGPKLRVHVTLMKRNNVKWTALIIFKTPAWGIGGHEKKLQAYGGSYSFEKSFLQ